MGAKSYRDLIAWQKGMDFAEAAHRLANKFPAEQRYSLTSQLRRSAISVPSNIAEGEGHFSNPNFKRFLSIAHGSLSEAETEILLAIRLGDLSDEESQSVLDVAAEVGKLIRGLAKSLN